MLLNNPLRPLRGQVSKILKISSLLKLENPESTSPNLCKNVKDNFLFDFNTNPLTKRAWILEDFRPNEDIAPVKRGRRKLERFYAQVGKPEDSKHRSLSVVIESQNSDYEFAFDNLRNRSKSPRFLEDWIFLSTQEGNEDKKEIPGNHQKKDKI
ncbi:BEM_HP_G0079040.mRNA.1.CDS.1 [Saccharomyces cerevisiae]|nr:BEM_HP_G0079040.mRNA.1.CDS.1 [Saccharomyces cerevisiae]CAI6990984.1 BEM_HP_G0079040.mRNA.1.CDS.1 [Saccharomyces cerevisiae]